MAGSSRYTAVLDANVLYPTLLRDILLSLATADLYHARWSAEIQHEWSSKIIESAPEKSEMIHRVVSVMNAAVPDCLVTGYEALINGIDLPDPDDRHVVAAAIVGHADAIVTFNLKDFPSNVLAPFNIEVQHPDQFINNQFNLHKVSALTAMKKMRARWKNPERSVDELVVSLEKRDLLRTADFIKEAAGLI